MRKFFSSHCKKIYVRLFSSSSPFYDASTSQPLAFLVFAVRYLPVEKTVLGENIVPKVLRMSDQSHRVLTPLKTQGTMVDG